MSTNTYEDNLKNVVLGLLTHRNLDELLENIIRSAGQIVNTTHGEIDLVDEKAGQLNTRVSMGMFREITRIPVKKGNGLSGKKDPGWFSSTCRRPVNRSSAPS